MWTVLLCDSAPDVAQRPFNYKALEAKRRGVPLIVHRPSQRLMEQRPVKISPSWPGYARFPVHQDNLYVNSGVEWAHWCYDTNGRQADLSHMLFGSQNIALQDISLIARLHRSSLEASILANNIKIPVEANGVGPISDLMYLRRTTEAATALDPEAEEFGATNAGGIFVPASGSTLAANFDARKRFLAYLADRILDFKSSTYRPFVNLTYSKLCFGDSMSIGIELPIAIKINKIDMISQLSVLDNQVLSRDAKFALVNDEIQDYFFSKYPAGLKDFYADILRQKKFSTNPRNLKFGISDIRLFFNYKLESQYWANGVAGLSLMVPSSPAMNQNYLWPAELGNGGFWQLCGHTAFFFKQSRLFNPHVFSELRFSFSSSVNRRVSDLISYRKEDEGNYDVKAKDLPLGEFLLFNRNIIDQDESNVPMFSRGPTQQILYKRGPEFVFRIGNVFNQLFSHVGSLDLYYQFRFKMSDSAAFRYDEGAYNVKALTNNTEQIEHLISGSYGYKISDRINLEANASYVFSGKCVARNTTFGLAALFKF